MALFSAMRCLTGELLAMSFNFTDSDRRLESDEAAAYEDAGLHASFGERAVTAVAVTLAILFVSVVAVLMGMA